MKYYRNALCPSYSNCLAIAAKLDSEFNCIICNYANEEVIKPIDIVSCALLLIAIFQPELLLHRGYGLDRLSLQQANEAQLHANSVLPIANDSN